MTSPVFIPFLSGCIMPLVRNDLPAGTVTFLFTDVEGSTKLLHELGAEAYADALAEHRRVIREAVAAHGGVEVDTQGDAFFVAFPTAPGALAAATEARDALAIPVRMGLYSGTPLVTEEGYVGPDVHRAARIAAAGHGRQILVSASAAALVHADLRDLGPHRLKDLSAPERIFQLGDGEFPPLKSLHQTNLPVPATPFLGREKELPEVVEHLGRTRLLTLTGPGGTGKTRLALAASALVAEDYPDGVWWVPLAPLRDPQLVLSTASQALGARNGPADHIGDKRMLVLFDNFEQVVDAATDVAQLVATCPNLDVLVTSREPLHVTGEQEYTVPPLVHQESVGFFNTRARAAVSDFESDESVSEICRRLDDLPLALELAAARVKALSTAQILERLDQRLPLLTGGARDLPERQRTLRATIEWSYELLSPREQHVFANLGVFRGGCTLDAAQAVAGADLDVLQSLVAKSLLRRTGERYWMLETIHEFATERTDDEIADRHAEYFVARAEEAEPHLRADDPVWVSRLAADLDNLRAALDRLEQTGETQSVMRFLGAASRLWYLRSLWRESWQRLESALAADAQPTAARAKVLRAAGAMAVTNGDFETARHRIEEALALNAAIGDPEGLAYSRFLLGFAAVEEGDFARARDPLEQSLREFRELGNDHLQGIVAINLAWAYDELGEFELAHELNENNLRRAKASGDDRLRFFSLSNLASDAERAGRTAEALSLFQEAIRVTQRSDDPFHTSYALMRVAGLIAATEAEPAANLLGYTLGVVEEIGLELPPYAMRRRDQILTTLRERLDEETLTRALERGRAMSLEAAVELALKDRGLAE
jgi:predicted ATPase/class 3 adenylate cyclase